MKIKKLFILFVFIFIIPLCLLPKNNTVYAACYSTNDCISCSCPGGASDCPGANCTQGCASGWNSYTPGDSLPACPAGQSRKTCSGSCHCNNPNDNCWQCQDNPPETHKGCVGCGQCGTQQGAGTDECNAGNAATVCACTPTPAPSTPTPTPQPPLFCQNLYTSSLTPALGDAITLTCEKNATYTAAVTYDFMLIKKETKAAADPVPSPTPFVQNSSNTLTTYTFPAGGYGYYLFMCRVCAGANCTAWQNPSIPSPTPTNTPIVTPTPTPLFSEYFESASLPAGWELSSSNSAWGSGWGDNTGTASIVASPAGLTGSTKSLQMVGHHVSGTNSRVQVCHYVPGINLSKTYTLSTSVYIPTSGTTERAEILVDGWDTGFTQKEQIIDYNTLPINLSTKGSWQKLSKNFKFTQSFVNPANVRVCLGVWNNQQALFDEVVIK